MESGRPRTVLSITVASTEGWDQLRHTYDVMRTAGADRPDVEVILVDGSGGTAPPDDQLGARTRWLEMPGADVAEMRMRAYHESVGELVTMTEDHVEVAPDWVDAILRAHAAHPEAAAIGGSVRNGSPKHRIDWASFYAGHAPYMAPLPRGEVPFISGVNVSYKRAPLLATLDRLGGRAIETLINEDIRAAGGMLMADDRIYVTHFQSRGIGPTTMLHFHAGRHFEGTRRQTRRDTAIRVLRAVAMPFPRAVKRLVTAARHGQPLFRVASAAPAMFLISTAQGAGELIGALFGRGESSLKLH